MTVVVRQDYGVEDLAKFEETTGTAIDFTMVPAWTRAAEVSRYGAGVRAAAFEDGVPIAFAQGITRTRHGFTTLSCGSNGGVGCLWAPDRKRAASDCIEDLARRKSPSAVNIFANQDLALLGVSWEPAYTFEIDLTPGLDSIFGRMGKNAVKHARRAEKLGVSIRISESDSDIEAAYGLIEEASEARRFPLPPRAYSMALHREFGRAGHQACVLALHDGQVVSAVSLIGHGRKVSWWKGGSTEEGYRASAGNLVQLAAIRWAKTRNATVYDLGGTDPRRQVYEGIHRFKSSLGGILVETRLGSRTSRLARLGLRALRAVRQSRGVTEHVSA